VNRNRNPMSDPTTANLDVQGTANAFGFEWTTHGDLTKLYGQPDDVLREFATFRIPDDFFSGKRVLDAGCGMGRWSWCALQKGAAEVQGFDLHDGIKCARQLCAGDSRASFQNGNIFEPPFTPSSFDSVMSIGVIHHTGDTRLAFASLVRLVKPGGRLFIQVYATRGAAKDRRMNRLLKFTSRLPHRLLYVFCWMAVVARRTPILKWLIQAVNHYVMIVSHARKRSFVRNVADTFDWHCCPYRTYHTHDEVMRWFCEEGFIKVQITNPEYGDGINCIGTVPTR
jgi:2-polyprenyl-3-methyl-5-hydroxy-6-metoxy-1,4-benzoquinol methylase